MSEPVSVMSGDLAQRAVLNLGAGLKHRADAINVDIRETTNPDVVHDLERRPWPFPCDHFREVIAFDVLEHIEDLVAAMEEIHRVTRAGGVVRITTPHFSCANAFTDITHRHFFSWYSLHYFTGENEFSFYSAYRFRRRVTSLIFKPSPVNAVVRRLANRWPDRYEARWAWMFPAWFLYFELEVVKGGGVDDGG